ncbi:hypothetical protein [Paractinoplanes atraurantiacus]|uniref:Uncharacterized protein n=1 Tax=Paractinoplanes atraurantiacus TaxID=1036182 RepID=A0A285HAU0_9ACTN|nr:hypothetical protein [Actinoplanes atraurantiacus]SNY32872.1 hypothetical protein SAMN05421748_10448 [Actinoplanes atraurantiacus]
MSGSAREEAERLVATALAALSTAIGSPAGTAAPHDSGTGSTSAGDSGASPSGHGSGSSGDSGASTSGHGNDRAGDSGGSTGGRGGDWAGGSGRGSAGGRGDDSSGGFGGGWAGGSGGGPDWGRLGGGLAAAIRAAGDRLGDLGGLAEGSQTGAKRDARGGGHWATGSPECCVCPVCKAIAATRDPSPMAAARLASSAGDIATGVAHLMRAVSAMTGERRRPSARPAPKEARPGNADQTWSSATRSANVRNTADRAWSATTNTQPSTGEDVKAAGDARSTATGGAADARSGARPSPGAGVDAWAAATTASAAAAAAEHAAELKARREAAQRAAAEAARRVAEAAEQARARRDAEAAREAAAAGRGADAGAGAGTDVGAGGSTHTGTGTSADAGTGGAGARAGVGRSGGGGRGLGETGDTAGGVGRESRTPRRFDVWAAATADAGVGDVAPSATVDHDVAGAEASSESGTRDARDGGAE